MQTAGEFARHIDFTAGPPEAKVLIESRDREVRLDERIKTLREAARLVCPRCAKGWPTLFFDSGRLLVHDGRPDTDAFPTCRAWAINGRVSELEAERDKEGKVE